MQHFLSVHYLNFCLEKNPEKFLAIVCTYTFLNSNEYIALYNLFVAIADFFYVNVFSFFCYLLSSLMWKLPHRHGVECWTVGTLLRPRMKKSCSSFAACSRQTNDWIAPFFFKVTVPEDLKITKPATFIYTSTPYPQPKCVHMIIKRKCSIFIIFPHLHWLVYKDGKVSFQFFLRRRQVVLQL